MELAFTHIEDYEEEPGYEWPATLIDITTKTPNELEVVWNRIVDTMDDRARNPTMFLQSVIAGDTALYDFGDGAGIIWVYSIEPGKAASISFVFDGTWRKFTRRFGPRDALRATISWIMESGDLQKLRAFIAASNEKAWKMAERVGFKREGQLRLEYSQGDQLSDIYAYGILRDEADAS